VTGFWQVSGRNQLSLEDRVKLEAWYVRNWTPWLDCIVLAKTFRVVLFPENGFLSEDQPVTDGASHRDSTSKAVSSVLSAKPCKSMRRSAGV
jgi:hypothetical protein